MPALLLTCLKALLMLLETPTDAFTCVPLTHCSDEGFFLEVLASPLTCFNASNYGAVMIVDSEDEFYKQVGVIAKSEMCSEQEWVC